MLYTITNSGLQNGRPTSIGSNTINIESQAIHTFTVANFTTETLPVYSDPEDDALSYIEILSITTQGILELNGSVVNVGDQISVAGLTTGNLIYTANQADIVGYSEKFQFDCADTGSNSLSGLSTGIITMEVGAADNLPPDVIGDKTVNLNYDSSHVFSAADFTTETTPAYHDPEGDDPSKVKILDLPDTGTLVFNGSNVVANQEITVAELDAGYLVWNPPGAVTNSINTTFNFAVSDEGSGEYTQ
tara:strand:+ start:16030 stop:16767 length:738 start_codon:yes stop_codon:yes gene_type:complete